MKITIKIINIICMACTNYLFNQQKIIDEVRKTKKKIKVVYYRSFNINFQVF